MPGQSYLVVESSLSDSILELATVIDHYNPEAHYVEKVNSHVITNEDDEEQFNEELFTELTAIAPLLASVPDKELESAANLAIFIFSHLESFESLGLDFIAQLVASLDLSTLNKKIYNRATATLSIISNVFNYIDEEDAEFKIKLFALILNIVEQIKNPELLVSLNAPELISSSEELLVKYANLVASINDNKSIEALLTAFKINKSQEILDRYLTQSLNSPSEIDLTHIIKESYNSPVAQLIVQYQTLPAKDFAPLLSASTLQGLNKVVIAQKNKYITLANFTLTSGSIISYAQLSEQLGVESSELEKLLITAIKARVLDAKLSQTEQELKVFSTKLVARELQKDDWTEIKELLNDWKTKVKDVKVLIDSAKKRVVKGA